MDRAKLAIAIDGPSGAGKSSLARCAAERFGFIYADTGAIYRTLGLHAYRLGVGSKDEAGVTALLGGADIDLRYDENRVQRMYLNGEDVTGLIREPAISIYASDVSAMPRVRGYLLEMQRELSRRSDVIMDGRDIGTVVLPWADLKIFLTATAEDRAKRRYLELKEKGVETTYEDVLRDLRYRDENDSSRAAAPLKAAEDAVVLDTTGNTLEQSRELVCKVIEERLKL